MFNERALFVTPDDVGKLILARGNPNEEYDSDSELVVGVVVASEEKHDVDYFSKKGSWHQKIYVAPASHFLVKQ